VAAKSISEIEGHLRDTIAALSRKREPIIVTDHDDPEAVLLAYSDYQVLLQQSGRGFSAVIQREGVAGGEPILRGTRIAVRLIVERLQANESIDDILEALPSLSRAQVYEALAFYYRNQAEIDQLIHDASPDRYLAAHGMVGQNVTDGVTIVHGANGKW
jgi:uncharacterized protein (DUF433 family)